MKQEHFGVVWAWPASLRKGRVGQNVHPPPI